MRPQALLALFFLHVQRSLHAQTLSIEPGAVVPDFTLERLDGGQLALADLRGHPILINFWGNLVPAVPNRDTGDCLRLWHPPGSGFGDRRRQSDRPRASERRPALRGRVGDAVSGGAGHERQSTREVPPRRPAHLHLRGYRGRGARGSPRPISEAALARGLDSIVPSGATPVGATSPPRFWRHPCLPQFSNRSPAKYLLL